MSLKHGADVETIDTERMELALLRVRFEYLQDLLVHTRQEQLIPRDVAHDGVYTRYRATVIAVNKWLGANFPNVKHVTADNFCNYSWEDLLELSKADENV
jgi:hypothetical protein